MKKISILFFAAILLMGFSSSNSYAQTGNNVLLEFCTGTWCPWCPCGDQIAEQCEQSTPGTMVLAYHGPYNYGGDPFTTFNGYNIISLLGFSAYPTGIIGRRTGIISRSVWPNQVTIQNSIYEPGVSISVNKTYNNTTRQLNVTANITASRNIDTVCYVNLVLTEDNIVYNQSGNSSCPGGSNYIHKWVVRNMVNGATGEQLNSGSWTQGTTISKNWTTTIDNAWVASNINVNVFVFFQSSVFSTYSYVQQTKKEAMIPTGINNQNEIPASYSLSQNYPNPFNPTTNIKFSIPKDGNVSLKVYDMLGNVVATYIEGFVKAGSYNAEVDASGWASGVYFYTLNASDFTQTHKMMLVK
jgi:hypothetical protein